jgi:DNA-binding Xre family transcriptional regulator
MQKAVFRLDEILKEMGTTPRPFARANGLNYVTILRICRNENQGITLDIISRLCEVLEVEPGDLFRIEKTGEQEK